MQYYQYREINCTFNQYSTLILKIAYFHIKFTLVAFRIFISVFLCSSFILMLSSFNKPRSFLKIYSSENNICDTTPVKDSADEIKVFDKVDIEASFPGGEKAWRKFLEKNLDATVPTRKRAPVGVYTVLIQFVVDKEGNITDIKALTKHGYGMEEEVMSLLKTAPRWKPAIQNGGPVKAYRRQPVTFMVMDEKKKRN